MLNGNEACCHPQQYDVMTSHYMIETLKYNGGMHSGCHNLSLKDFLQSTSVLNGMICLGSVLSNLEINLFLTRFLNNASLSSVFS